MKLFGVPCLLPFGTLEIVENATDCTRTKTKNAAYALVVRNVLLKQDLECSHHTAVNGKKFAPPYPFLLLGPRDALGTYHAAHLHR